MLYTSETCNGAVAERRFHLYQGQPIPPSRVRYELFELSVSLEAAVRFADLQSVLWRRMSVTRWCWPTADGGSLVARPKVLAASGWRDLLGFRHDMRRAANQTYISRQGLDRTQQPG